MSGSLNQESPAFRPGSVKARITPITLDERDLLEAEARKIVPNFLMFDLDDFREALAAAAEYHRHTKKVLDDAGRVSIPKLVRHVLTDMGEKCRHGFGAPFAWWWIFAELHILEGIDSDPWSECRWWLFEELRGTGKTLTMHGSQNSGKTSWSGRFAIVQMIVWTVDAVIYVSSPHKSHGEDKSWQDSVGKWAAYLKTNRSAFVRTLGVSIKTAKHLVEITDDRGTAIAKFVSAEESSTIQGKKSSTHETNGLRGIMCVMVDEFVENPYLDLRRINGNASSNFNFFMVLMCNPDPELTNHPNLREFSAPIDVASLDRTRHFRWRTAYGVCVRFAWANSPNKTINRTRWPYLIDETRVGRQREKGANIIDSQVDAWFCGSSAAGSPLDEAQARMSGAYLEPIWAGVRTRFMFIDCAFGGRDPAVAFIGEAGRATFKGRDGAAIEKDAIAAVDQLILPVAQQFEVTREWMEEIDELLAWSGGSWPEAVKAAGITPGQTLNGNYHLAYLSLKTARDHGIPATNVSFDSSQRGDATSIMLDFFGRHNIRWFYEGTRRIVDEEVLTPGWYRWPYSYVKDDDGKERPELWSEYVTQTISMAWFMACEMIKQGMLCRALMCKKGIEELCARQIAKRRNSSEGKKDVVSKEVLKSMGLKSPAYGETLALGLYFATRYLKLMPLPGPKLATHVSQPQSTNFIRAGLNRSAHHALRGRRTVVGRF